MAGFRARQVAHIRDAVAAARAALHGAGRYETGIFAEAFVAAGGAQVPGGDPAAGEALGRRLLCAVRRGQREAPGDPDLQRELRRVHQEVEWARLQGDDTVVGLRLELPSGAENSPVAEALAHQSQGLGPGVFRKGEIVILPPDCDGARFHPVSVHEVEC